MKWLWRLLCMHKWTTKYPLPDPAIWGYYYECGKCGHKKDVTKEVVFGEINFDNPITGDFK